MSQDDDGQQDAAGPAVLVDAHGSGWRRWAALLPAVAFVAGLLLGGAVVGAATRDTGSGGAVAPSPSPSATAAGRPAGPPPPGACVQAADRADSAYATLERASKAATNLDAAALADVLGQVQQQRPEVQALVQQCREQAAAVGRGPTPSPSG